MPFSALLTLAVIGSLIAVLWHKSPQPATDWALTLAGALYLGWLLNHFVLLRAETDGVYWLLLGALSIWAADVTAYFAGRAFGRHPWWPRHSPKKTWEGYLAGVAAAALVVMPDRRLPARSEPVGGRLRWGCSSASLPHWATSPSR